MKASLLVLVLLLAVASGFLRRDIVTLSQHTRLEGRAVNYQTAWFTQKLDHFNWANSNATYQQRWLYNEQHWDGKGPILFYTGNEGDITLFWENTGFVTKTLAQQLKGLVVFAEHRYYGLSLPFGNQSLTPQNAVYLSSEQALADCRADKAHQREDERVEIASHRLWRVVRWHAQCLVQDEVPSRCRWRNRRLCTYSAILSDGSEPDSVQ